MPARGGSKRIPKKNIKLFNGKPMILWPLEVLKNSNLFENIIVSTDSHDIKKIVEKNGVVVPFLRPDNISDDFTDTPTVIKHAVNWYLDNVGEVDYVLTVYPTAVFLNENDITQAYKTLINFDCEIVMAATEYPYPIQRAFYLDEFKNINLFQPKYQTSRSQDLLPAYHDAGQFYFSTKDALLKDVSAFSKKGRPYLLPRYKAIDIDTMDDFKIAENLFAISNLKTFQN